MGLGGILTWSAVAREIVKKSGNPDLKILPIEASNGSSAFKVIRSEIFQNNPKYATSLEPNISNYWCFPLVLNDPRTNYCIQDLPDRAVHRHDKHVIQQICEVYGIKGAELKCELYLTEAEKKYAQQLIASEDPRPICVIEPHCKQEYGVNKLYPFQKWQLVVDSLPGIRFVQVGVVGNQALQNVLDLSGKTSFREAAAVISLADLYLGAEGGLMHAANAVGTKAVIIFTGFLHPTMTGYPENVNIWIGRDHGPCGMKILCQKCYNNAQQHDPNEIVSEVSRVLGV